MLRRMRARLRSDLSPSTSLKGAIGYRINSVDGSRFYNDPRDVAGSLVSRYQSPFASVAYTVHPGWTWKAEYNYFSYSEGPASGAAYCSTSNPTPTTAAPVVACSSLACPANRCDPDECRRDRTAALPCQQHHPGVPLRILRGRSERWPGFASAIAARGRT